MLFKSMIRLMALKSNSKTRFIVDTDVTSMYTGYVNLDYARLKKPIDFVGYNNTNLGVGKFSLDGYIEGTGSMDSASKIGTIWSHADGLYFWVGFAKGTTITQAKTNLVGKALTYQSV